MNGPITAISAKFKFNTFKQQTIGGTAAAITPPTSSDEVGLNVLNNIFVQALSTNSTGIITLKNKSDVTAGGAGIELVAGANYNLPGIKASDWYIIGSTSGLKLNILYSNVVI